MPTIDDNPQQRQQRREDFERAVEAVNREYIGTRAKFRSVAAALRWYFEARERMAGPNPAAPMTDTAPDGSQVHVRVDGGRGGDIDGVLATMSTIGTALERIGTNVPARPGRPQAIGPAAYRWLLTAHYRGIDGVVPEGASGHERRPGAPWTCASIARKHGVWPQTAADALARAERAMVPALQEAGLIP